MTDRTPAEILEAARANVDRSQVRFAVDVLGVNDRSYRQWIAGAQCWPPIVRLAWLIERHPELAEELATKFPTKS